MKATTCNWADIGGRIRAAREALGLSRPAFITKYGGVTLRTLENNEGGLNQAGVCLVAAFVRAGINANWLLTDEGPMLLSDLSSTDILDTARLRLSVETVEEGLRVTKRTMAPGKKAELILAVYDLYADGVSAQVKERVLRLVKSAA